MVRDEGTAVIPVGGRGREEGGVAITAEQREETQTKERQQR